jgi:hypothetical protein
MSGVDEFRWDDDDELLAELGEAVRAGQSVPESFLEAGRGAFGWRAIEAEFAELTADSASAAGELVGTGMRASASSPRTLRFTSGDLSIEIEVHVDALRGQLVPPQPGTIQVLPDTDDSRVFTADEVGWFVISPRPTSPIQLHVRTEAGASVRTDQFTV